MYKVNVDTFEGPLELLLHLIRKREVSIYDIPISEITDEFLTYLERMRELNIPLASEFLVMAATLTKIKSEMLTGGESDDPRRELVRAIEDYLLIKKGEKELEKLERKAAERFSNRTDNIVFRFQERVKIANTPDDLKLAFERAVARRRGKRLTVGMNLESERFKIHVKVEQIRNLFKERDVLSFSYLTRLADCRLEAITFFLAVLEVCRLGEASIFQDGEDIIISKISKLPFKDFSLALEEADPVDVGSPAEGNS